MFGTAEVNSKSFRMSQLPSIFGRELSYRTTFEGNHLIHFVIYPCEDLFISSIAELEIEFPPNFQTSAGEVTISAKQPELFKDCGYLSFSNHLSFPWLEGAIKYPISVWFYAVRQLLKRGKRCPWLTPVLITASFEDNREQMATDGLVEISDPPAVAEGETPLGMLLRYAS